MRRWLVSYRLGVEWHLRQLLPWLPVILGFQLITGCGAAIGIGFLFPGIPESMAMYLSTGAPTAMLLGLGLAIVPGLVGRAKEAGTIDFMMTLPLPRLAYLASDLTVWCFLTLPGAALALAMASNRYGFDLQVSPLVVPVTLMTVVTATAIGYAYALASPSLTVTKVIGNFAILFIFLLSPVNYPSERLPDVLAAIHSVLPIEAASDLMRATLDPASDVAVVGPSVVLAAWSVVALCLAHSLLSWRR